MDVLGVYTRYSELGASSRLRYYAYAQSWRDAGFAPEFHPFYPARYLRRLYAGRGASRLLAGASLLRRLLLSVRLPERLVLEYELLPYLPAGVEKALLRGHRYVLNFDDNVWEKYLDSPHLSGKYDALVEGASGVIVANRFLRERVEVRNSNVIEIPTAVDLDAYPAGRVPRRERTTVAWIGTPVTYPYLEAAAPALQAMRRVADFRLLVLASRGLAARPIPGIETEYQDWSPETEGADLAACHFGIMPLNDDPFSRGKSAYKLIQYLAAGLPVIASPVGENNRVVKPGANGFLAASPQEWADAFRRLLDTPRNDAARESARAYSLQFWRPVCAGFLKEALW